MSVEPLQPESPAASGSTTAPGSPPAAPAPVQGAAPASRAPVPPVRRRVVRPVDPRGERDAPEGTAPVTGGELLDELARTGEVDVPPLDEDADQVGGDADDADDGGAGAEPRPSRRAARRAARLRARKVRRVVHRIEPWSVLKVSFAFYLCLWLVLTVAGVILWQIVVRTGTIDDIESFVAELTSNESYDIDGGQILRASAIAGLVLVFAGTAITGLMTVLLNLISDLTGGIRLAVVELESARVVVDDGTGGSKRRARRGRGRRRSRQRSPDVR